MKTNLKTIATIIISACFTTIVADETKKDDHDHDHHDHDHHEKVAGPNGGRVFTSVEPHLEFLVMNDRKVKITALNDDLKPIEIAEQIVRVTGGDRQNPTRLSFKKEGSNLVSDVAFPAGNDFPIVVQIKSSGDTKAVMEKFNLNLTDCPTCEYKEYACTCEHGDDHEKGDK